MVQVRVNALLCLGEVVPRLDKVAIQEVLQTLQRCTAVDHSAPTLMCSLGVVSAIHKQMGVEYAAEYLLPLVCPLLTAQQLNLQQFAKYMDFVKEILRKLEEKRGVVNEVESVSLDMKTMALSGPAKESVKATGNGIGDPYSWDADWTAARKAANSATTIDNGLFPKKAATAPAPAPAPTPTSSVVSTPPPQHQPALSFEWPPPTSAPNLMTKTPIASNLSTKASNPGGMGSGFSSPNLNSVSSYQTATQASDDSDPFWNWPLPQSSSTSTQSSWNSGPISSNSQSLSNLKTSKGSSNSMLSARDWTMPRPQEDSTDFGDFFSSSPKRQDAPLKLAPPPAIASGLGKGRGRNPIRPIQPSQARHKKSNSSEQPPLLDLL